MPSKKHGRQYDLVVLGATGYTGQLTAEYITKHLPTDLKWAVAGRSEGKLRALVEECKSLNADRLAPSIELASVDNEEQLTALARRTFVLITAVGPYCLYGEHALKACAESGTHYLDVTGEVVWVKRMITKYHATAEANGAIIIPQAGFESAPADLCTWALAGCLRKQLGAQTQDVNLSVRQVTTLPSGGTYASVIALLENYPIQEIMAAQKPYASSPIPHEAPTRPAQSIMQLCLGLHEVPNLGLLTTALFGSSDCTLVERTWGLLSQIPSRKQEFYGPKFRWAEGAKPRNWLYGIFTHWSIVIAMSVLALVPPVRALVKKVMFQPGHGPSKETGAKDEVEFRGVAEPDTETPTGKQAFCRAKYAGSVYYFTGVLVASAAWTILEDDVGLDGGMYTPACLGQGFVDRVADGGFKIDVKIIDK